MNKLFGVNIATGTFGQTNDSGTLPGTLGTTYLYCTNPAEYQYYKNKGFALFRLNVMWERLQNTALGPLSAPDVEGLTAMINAVNAVGGQAIIDVHNFARYYNVPLVEGDETLADLWTKLATQFKGTPGLYAYELMNEPNNLVGNGQTWASIAQTVINAIRKVDAVTPIIVNGYNWQHADGWAANNPTFPLTDPVNKIYYSAHVYFDGDESGGYWDGAPNANNNNGTLLVTGAGNFINWLQENNQLGLITEYGVPFGPGATTPLTTQWFLVLQDFLNTLNNSEQIVGATAWAGGEWWGNYNLTIEPADAPTSFTIDRPSMGIYEKFPSVIATVTPTPTPPVGEPVTPLSILPAFSFTGNVSISSDGKGSLSISLSNN